MVASLSDYKDEKMEAALYQLEVMRKLGAVVSIIGMYYATCMNKSKMREPQLSGYDWVMRTLNNPTSCFNMFRMSKQLFERLHDLLVLSYGLKSTIKMSSVEALGFFL